MAMVQGLKKETLRHQEAFDYYYSLGENRSYAKVADKFNVALGTVTKWAGSFSWQRRVIERDRKISLQMQRDLDKQILEDKKNYRKIIQASVKKYIDNLSAGKVTVNSVKDLDMLLRLDKLFMDDLDKGTADDFNNLISVSGETSDTVNRLMDELSGVVEPPDLEEEGDEDA